MSTNNIFATIVPIDVDDLCNVQQRHFPLPFLLLQPLNVHRQQHKERKEKRRKKGGKEKKKNRNDNEMGPLLVGGPFSLLTSYKLFSSFFTNKTPPSTLWVHMPHHGSNPQGVL
jgi:hypothetical protein